MTDFVAPVFQSEDSLKRLTLEDAINMFTDFGKQDAGVYIVGDLAWEGAAEREIGFLIKSKKPQKKIENAVYERVPEDLRHRVAFYYEDDIVVEEAIPLHLDYEDPTRLALELDQTYDRDYRPKLRNPVFYKYPGNKRNMSGWICEHIPESTKNVVEPFMGALGATYAFKRMGYTVHGNDISAGSFHLGKAVIENTDIRISDSELEELLSTEYKNVKGYAAGYDMNNKRSFDVEMETKQFLDALMLKANDMDEPKKSMVKSAAVGAFWMMSVVHAFTTTGNERKKTDLETFKKNFTKKIRYFNKAVFYPGHNNSKIYNRDATDFIKRLPDMENTTVYMDPPYISETSTISSYSPFELSESIVFQEGVRYAGKDNWTKKNFPATLEGIVKESSKYDTIMISYGMNKMFGPKFFTSMLQKYKKNVVVYTKNVLRPMQHKMWKEWLFVATDKDLKEITLNSRDSVMEKLELEEYEGRIAPFAAVTLPHGLSGYKKNEVYNGKDLLARMQKPDSYPAEVLQSYDGVRVQIHKKGDKVRIYDERKQDISKALPTIVSEFESWQPGVVLDAFISGWEGDLPGQGKTMGRAEVAMQLSKNTMDKNLRANIIDIMWVDNRDLTGHPLSNRHQLLEKLEDFARDNDEFIHHMIAPIKIVESEDDIGDAVTYFSRMPGSDGAIIRPHKSTYSLSGQSEDWIEFRNEVCIDAEVLFKTKVRGAGESYNYLCAVRDQENKAVPIGNTYDTPINVPVGGVIRVALTTLNKYTDPRTGGAWYAWVGARALEYREDRTHADTTGIAEQIVTDTDGEVEAKALPSRFTRQMEYSDPFLQYSTLPDKRFVVQAHIDGNCVSLDMRRQVDNDFAVGVTINLDKKLKRKPKSFEDAQALVKEYLVPEIVSTLSNSQRHFNAEMDHESSMVDKMDLEGETEGGYTVIVDTGLYQQGTLDRHYRENFFNGELFNGKILEREAKGGGWLFSRSKSPPYVITKRAVQKGYLPPRGYSGLPRTIENKTPPEYRYWEMENRQEAIKVRDALIAKIRSRDVSVFESMWSRYKLQKQVFEDDMKLRTGPTREIYHLTLDTPHQKQHVHFNLTLDPTEHITSKGTRKDMQDDTLLELEGKVSPKSRFNPTKRESIVRTLSEDCMEVLEFSRWKMKLRFNSGPMEGTYDVYPEVAGKDQAWVMEKISGPGEIVSLSFETIDSPPWGDIPKTKENFPDKSDFIMQRGDTWSDWKLPYKYKGKVHCGGVRAVLSAVGGARSGEAMNLNPEEKARLERAKKACKIGENEMEMNFEVSMEYLEFSHPSANPEYLDIEGILFTPGIHKGKIFSKEKLQAAKLTPRQGESLVFINLFHLKKDPFRIGIMKKIWWDEEKIYKDKSTGEKMKGALMFKGSMTDPQGIELLVNKNIHNDSAELLFDYNDPKVGAENIGVTGMAMTNIPAVRNAGVEQALSDHGFKKTFTP